MIKKLLSGKFYLLLLGGLVVVLAAALAARPPIERSQPSADELIGDGVIPADEEEEAALLGVSEEDGETITSILATDDPSALASGVLPRPQSLRIVHADKKFVTVDWSLPKNNEQAKRVVGYHVVWGPESNPEQSKAVTVATVFQPQLLELGKKYKLKVRSVDTFGKTSDFSDTIEFTPNTTSIDHIKSVTANGFFDDFDLPTGPFDARQWSTNYNGCTHGNGGGAFINSQFHAHNTNDAGGVAGACDRRITSSVPTGDPLSLADGKMREVTHYFDGSGLVGGSNDWLLTFWPASQGKPLLNTDTASRITPEEGKSYPAGKVNIRQHGKTVRVEKVGPNGELRVLKSATISPKEIKLFPNVRHPSKTLISKNRLEFYLLDKLILSVDNLGLTEDKYYVLQSAFTYPGPNNIINFHWGPLAFTQPPGYESKSVTHRYFAKMHGLHYALTKWKKIDKTDDKEEISLVINIPDSLAGASRARYRFSIEQPSLFGKRLAINNARFTIPKATFNLEPMPTNLRSLVHQGKSYTVNIDLPVNVLRSGDNEIRVERVAGARILNSQIEVDFPKGKEPAFTQPNIIFRSEPEVPSTLRNSRDNKLLGPGAVIKKIGDHAITRNISRLLQAMSNQALPELSGDVPIVVDINNEKTLLRIGANPGIVCFNVRVGDVLVASQRTDETVPAPAVKQTIIWRTTEFSDGEYPISLTAWDVEGRVSKGNPRYPFFVKVKNESGAASVTSAKSVTDNCAKSVVPAAAALPAKPDEHSHHITELGRY